MERTSWRTWKGGSAKTVLFTCKKLLMSTITFQQSPKCGTNCRDYRAMPALDRYDQRDMDDDVEEGTFEEREVARLRAEQAMDRTEGRRRTRLPGALLEGAAMLHARNWQSLSGTAWLQPRYVATLISRLHRLQYWDAVGDR